MNFTDCLIRNGIVFKKQEYNDNCILFKIKNAINIVFMNENSSSFKLDRDLFYYLINQNLPYAFVLFNKKENKVFYLEFKDKINWLASSFERCNKNSLYLGKIVLNNQSDEMTILKQIQIF
ncbi:hypothetical protein SANA_03490 [Gottschalkiaceae bacterium SANA]|nr:hypothetical protein SANA_03490 [Gottschalkiaceae bacterium SANA]